MNVSSGSHGQVNKAHAQMANGVKRHTFSAVFLGTAPLFYNIHILAIRRVGHQAQARLFESHRWPFYY